MVQPCQLGVVRCNGKMLSKIQPKVRSMLAVMKNPNTYTPSMQTLLFFFCHGPNTRSTTPGLLQLQQTMGGGVTHPTTL